MKEIPQNDSYLEEYSEEETLEIDDDYAEEYEGDYYAQALDRVEFARQQLALAEQNDIELERYQGVSVIKSAKDVTVHLRPYIGQPDIGISNKNLIWYGKNKIPIGAILFDGVYGVKTKGLPVEVGDLLENAGIPIKKTIQYRIRRLIRNTVRRLLR